MLLLLARGIDQCSLYVWFNVYSITLYFWLNHTFILHPDDREIVNISDFLLRRKNCLIACCCYPSDCFSREIMSLQFYVMDISLFILFLMLRKCNNVYLCSIWITSHTFNIQKYICKKKNYKYIIFELKYTFKLF